MNDKFTQDDLAHVSFSEDALYRVKDGQLEKLDRPESGYGEVIVKWKDNKMWRYEVKYTKVLEI